MQRDEMKCMKQNKKAQNCEVKEVVLNIEKLLASQNKLDAWNFWDGLRNKN